MRHGMREYDDMGDMGLYDDMGQFMTPQMLQEQLMAAGAGAGAILLAAWGLPKLKGPADWSEVNQHRFRAAAGIVVAGLVARGIWDTNRDAAIALLGGVGGLALAQLIDSYFDANLLGGGYPLGVLPEDTSLMDAYDSGSMSALAALETVGVQSTPGAFAPAQFSDPTVTPEALMGVVTQQETLGQYAPWLS